MIKNIYQREKRDVLITACGILVFFLGYLFFSSTKLHNSIFYALVLFPLLFSAQKKHFLDLHSSYLINGLLVFLFYSVCTTFWSDYYSIDLLFRTFKRFMYIYGLFLAFYIVIESYSNFPNFLLKFWTGLLSIFATISVVLFLAELHPHYSEDPNRMWGLGALFHPSFFATILLAYVSGLFVYAIDMKKINKTNNLYIFMSFYAVIQSLFVIYLADSRSAIVSIASMLVFYGSIEGKWKWIISIFVIGVTILCLVWQFSPEDLFGRPSYRFDIWSTFIDKWQKCSYLFGCGMNGWKTTIVQTATGGTHMHAHSVYIGQLHTGGIIQLFGYCAVLLCFIYEATLHKRSRPWAIVLIAGITMTLFDGSKILTTPSPLWLTLLIPMSVIAAISITNTKKR